MTNMIVNQQPQPQPQQKPRKLFAIDEFGLALLQDTLRKLSRAKGVGFDDVAPGMQILSAAIEINVSQGKTEQELQDERDARATNAAPEEKRKELLANIEKAKSELGQLEGAPQNGASNGEATEPLAQEAG